MFSHGDGYWQLIPSPVGEMFPREHLRATVLDVGTGQHLPTVPPLRSTPKPGLTSDSAPEAFLAEVSCSWQVS